MHSSEHYQIEQILESLRPAIHRDGGDVELVSYAEGVVSLRLVGACATCPLSLYTLKLGIEDRLKDSIPGITKVVQVE
jgi:Fe-S cluster biogenesis protein NfuA